MSDIMLTGVLRMPMPDDPKDLDSVTWVQFVGRAREAADTLTALQAENERLREALAAMVGRYSIYCGEGMMFAGDTDRAVMEQARAALSQTGEVE